VREWANCPHLYRFQLSMSLHCWLKFTTNSNQPAVTDNRFFSLCRLLLFFSLSTTRMLTFLHSIGLPAARGACKSIPCPVKLFFLVPPSSIPTLVDYHCLCCWQVTWATPIIFLLILIQFKRYHCVGFFINFILRWVVLPDKRYK
jgi:hypothetical protein